MKRNGWKIYTHQKWRNGIELTDDDKMENENGQTMRAFIEKRKNCGAKTAEAKVNCQVINGLHHYVIVMCEMYIKMHRLYSDRNKFSHMVFVGNGNRTQWTRASERWCKRQKNVHKRCSKCNVLAHTTCFPFSSAAMSRVKHLLFLPSQICSRSNRELNSFSVSTTSCDRNALEDVCVWSFRWLIYLFSLNIEMTIVWSIELQLPCTEMNGKLQ